jgi:hypothetical protein
VIHRRVQVSRQYIGHRAMVLDFSTCQTITGRAGVLFLNIISWRSESRGETALAFVLLLSPGVGTGLETALSKRDRA